MSNSNSYAERLQTAERVNHFFLAILALAISFFAGMFTAFVMTRLWSWFIVPLGVAPIGIFHAMGITGLLFLLTNSVTRREGKGERLWQKILDSVFWNLTAAAISLGFGSLYHSLM